MTPKMFILYHFDSNYAQLQTPEMHHDLLNFFLSLVMSLYKSNIKQVALPDFIVLYLTYQTHGLNLPIFGELCYIQSIPIFLQQRCQSLS